MALNLGESALDDWLNAPARGVQGLHAAYQRRQVRPSQVVERSLALARASEPGLFTCLLESTMSRGLGFTVTVPGNIRADAALFGEAQGRAVVTINNDLHQLFEAELKGLPFFKLGHVNAQKEILINNDNWGYVADWAEAYDTAIEKLINQ